MANHQLRYLHRSLTVCMYRNHSSRVAEKAGVLILNPVSDGGLSTATHLPQIWSKDKNMVHVHSSCVRYQFLHTQINIPVWPVCYIHSHKTAHEGRTHWWWVGSLQGRTFTSQVEEQYMSNFIYPIFAQYGLYLKYVTSMVYLVSAPRCK